MGQKDATESGNASCGVYAAYEKENALRAEYGILKQQAQEYTAFI